MLARFGRVTMASRRQIYPSMVANKVAESTFQYQEKLPLLPVPDLEDTCQTYLKTVAPVLEGEEFEATKKAVNSFLSGQGPLLQQRLLQHAEKFKHNRGSWLWKWWLDYAYMSYRESEVINSNYYFLFDDQQPPKDLNLYAAKLIHGVLEFHQMLINETVPVDKLRGVPVCMDQYKKLFTVCRVPREECDQLREYQSSKWIMIFAKSQIFILNVYDEEGKIYPIPTLIRQIEEVRKIANQTDPAKVFPIGASTAEHRDKWTKIRDGLVRLHETNRNNFDLIEKALFSISFDDYAPVDRDDAGHNGLAGNATNRYFDKLMSFVIFSNGYCGINGEHSPIDAPCLGTLVNYANRRIAKLDINHAGGHISQSKKLPDIKKLSWEFTDDLKKEVNESVAFSVRHHNNIKVKLLYFEEFGADWIKSVAKASPDAFVQMSIQLAYYTLMGHDAPTYESASTRKFLQGRTETCRTLSVDSKKWTHEMVATNSKKDKKYLRSLLDTAMNSHLNYMQRCTEARGVDRHLMSLKFMLKEGEPVPPIYTDKAFAATKRYRISTSNMNGETFIVTFGPTEPDGYGICYQIRNYRLQYGVSSFVNCKETDAGKMRESIQKALNDMRELYTDDTPSAKL